MATRQNQPPLIDWSQERAEPYSEANYFDSLRMLRLSRLRASAELAPSPTTFQAWDRVHRLVTRRALVPTGKGTGRLRPGRARSPSSSHRSGSADTE